MVTRGQKGTKNPVRLYVRMYVHVSPCVSLRATKFETQARHRLERVQQAFGRNRNTKNRHLHERFFVFLGFLKNSFYDFLKN